LRGKISLRRFFVRQGRCLETLKNRRKMRSMAKELSLMKEYVGAEIEGSK